MCFSATASYSSAALLIAAGTATTIGNTSKSLRMVAAIPLIFGFQQVTEGIIWQTMGLNTSKSLHQFAVMGFLVFALVVWPSWLPWSIYKIEKNQKRKRVLQIIGVIGLSVSLLSALILYNVDVKAYVTGHSLGYSLLNLHRHWPPNLEFLLYDTATLLPFFISSLRTVKIAGYMVFGGMALALVVNQTATTSIWCFFAALISLYIAMNILWAQRAKLIKMPIGKSHLSLRFPL